MDHTQAILDGQETPTVQDFIEWIEEHALNEGAIGLSMETSDKDMEETFYTYWPGDIEEGVLDDLENCHIIAMEEKYAATLRREQQAKIMEENQELLAKTEIEVNNGLRNAGISVEKLDQELRGTPTPLRKKVIALHKATHDMKVAEGGVDAYLYLGDNYEHKFLVYLPLVATLAEVCWLMKGVCIAQYGGADAFPDGDEPQWEKKIWRYNLLAADNKTILKNRSVELRTDMDYQTMIKEVTEKGTDAPTALITVENFKGEPKTVQSMEIFNRWRSFLNDTTANDEGRPLDEDDIPCSDNGMESTTANDERGPSDEDLDEDDYSYFNDEMDWTTT